VIVVADTTPLLYLSRVGHVELLRVLYQQLIVPATVWQEVVGARPDAPGVDLLRSAPWIVVSDRAERAGVEPALEEALDAGEAAAITLAELLSASVLLIDERKGRAVARARGLTVRGTLGVLVEARRLGHIASLRIAIDALRAQGFGVAPVLVSEALRQVGEE
jgi:predicted nucleic acid-binding protein